MPWAQISINDARALWEAAPATMTPVVCGSIQDGHVTLLVGERVFCQNKITRKPTPNFILHPEFDPVFALDRAIKKAKTLGLCN